MDNDHTLELSSDMPEVPTTEVLTARTLKKRPKPRKRSHRKKQIKVSTHSPTIDPNVEARTEGIVRTQISEDSGYELHTEPNVRLFITYQLMSM